MKFMRRLVQLFVLSVLVLVPLAAMAQAVAAATAGDVKQEWWQALLSWVLPLVGAIVTAVVGTLVGALLRKWKINIDQTLIDKAVGSGVNYAEGKALSALNAGKAKTDGAEKMEMALSVASSLIAQYKVKELVTGKLKELIEAKLGEVKVEEKKALLTNVVSVPKDGAPAVKIPTWAQ